jgi:predicted RNase H-like nuclease (RuvC/YqgF family)
VSVSARNVSHVEIDWPDVVKIVGGGVLGSALTLLVTWVTRKWQRDEAHQERLRVAFEDFIDAADRSFEAHRRALSFVPRIRQLEVDGDALLSAGEHVASAQHELESTPDDQLDDEEVRAIRQSIQGLQQQQERIKRSADTIKATVDESRARWENAIDQMRRKIITLQMIETNKERLRLLSETLATLDINIEDATTEQMNSRFEAQSARLDNLRSALAGAFAPGR